MFKIVVTWAATLIAGFCIGWSACSLNHPDCPTEDSCTVDYRDGAWHIEEVRP